METEAVVVVNAKALNPGEFRVTLTKAEWNMLHHLIYTVQVFSNVTASTENGTRALLLQTAARIKAKLPPPGAGSY